MFGFARSIAGWGSDEFVLRLNELRALVISLFIMGGIAVAAFVACAVLRSPSLHFPACRKGT